MAVTSSAPAEGNGEGAEVLAGGRDTDQRTPCPPECALASRWPRDVRLNDRWPASTELCWTLVGLGDDPLPPERWAAAIDAIEGVAGPLAVARGLDLAARQPSMAPHQPVTATSRWWTAVDQQRAAQLADVYRRKSEGWAA